MGTADDLRGRLREQAEGSFVNILEDIDHQGVNIEKMTVVGLPFLEILKIARDLDLPMIVMGVKGSSTPTAEVLFGSTAERVLRGSRVPVLCVPC
jgi:nucleotide-binding universal stress UspA family protein